MSSPSDKKTADGDGAEAIPQRAPAAAAPARPAASAGGRADVATAKTAEKAQGAPPGPPPSPPKSAPIAPSPIPRQGPPAVPPSPPDQSDGDAYWTQAPDAYADEYAQEEVPSEQAPVPDLSRLKTPRRVAELNEKTVHRLIDLKSNLSTIELTLTAITIAVIVLKVTFGELSVQIGAAMSGAAGRQLLDTSIFVGFVTIAVATLQIPKHFTDALIYSNQDTMRILQMVGATPRFVANCFAKVVLGSMLKAAWKGLLVTAVLYLVVSELAQLWVPVTRTYFLREVLEAVVGILVFIGVMNLLLRRKVIQFYDRFRR